MIVVYNNPSTVVKSIRTRNSQIINPNPNPKLATTHLTPIMDTYSASPYPLLDGNNGADTPGAFFFRRKNKKTIPCTKQPSPAASSSTYEASIAHSDATTLVPDDMNTNKRDADLLRPTTPAQGSRSNPWSSYHDLPSKHPVFAYSDKARAELYERGVGEPHCGSFLRSRGSPSANVMYATDPIVQAEVDAAKENMGPAADCQVKGFWKQSASRLKTFAAR